jgi:hypothetical protein
MKTQGFTLFTLFLLALVSCGNPQHKAMLSIPPDAPEVFVDPTVDMKAKPSSMRISHAEQLGDYLVINVSYSGGCEDHEFTLVSRGKFTATYPPEVEVTLKHDDKGDGCRAMIDEKRYFDLRPLRYNGTNRINLVLTNSNRIVEYTY